MTEHISLERRNGSRLVHRITVSQMAIIASLASLTASAERPCPPDLSASNETSIVTGGQSCPVSEALTSDTPDYADPLMSCRSMSSRRVVNVASTTALQTAMAEASCGDSIQLAPGSYGGSFAIDASCPMNAPVIISGAPNFASIVTGDLRLRGARTIVAGLKFSGPNTGVRLSGTNNKIIGNRFTDWRHIAVIAETGKQGEIAYNEFSKPHPWLSSEATGYPLRISIRTAEKDSSSFHYDAWVHHNYFHDLPAKPVPDKYHSGQSDAIEVCQTRRPSTSTLVSGWYVESNLIERHMQGHGIIDLKCGGNVVRENTVLDSPSGRIDIRGASHNVLEGNWIENSGGSAIHGGYNKIIGNYIRGGQLNVMAGNLDWNDAGDGYPRAYKTFLSGNIVDKSYVGKTYGDASQFPALDTVVEAHSGSTPVLQVEINTSIRSSTNAHFAAPFKLSSGDIGPSAITTASDQYLACRVP